MTWRRPRPSALPSPSVCVAGGGDVHETGRRGMRGSGSIAPPPTPAPPTFAFSDDAPPAPPAASAIALTAAATSAESGGAGPARRTPAVAITADAARSGASASRGAGAPLRYFEIHGGGAAPDAPNALPTPDEEFPRAAGRAARCCTSALADSRSAAERGGADRDGVRKGGADGAGAAAAARPPPVPPPFNLSALGVASARTRSSCAACAAAACFRHHLTNSARESARAPPDGRGTAGVTGNPSFSASAEIAFTPSRRPSEKTVASSNTARTADSDGTLRGRAPATGDPPTLRTVRDVT
jgi:hypothetical protein